ncbi:MAG: plastocyanin/azurin family copper-binding protein [Candidatus Nitrosotenuis sp.]
MNTKLLASIAVFALVTSLVASSVSSVYAMEDKMMDKKGKIDMKMDAKKMKMDKKMDDKKAKMDKKMDDKKAKKDTAPAGAATNDATVEIPKGVATKNPCTPNCYSPSTVAVKAGGKVTWKNLDNAAHSATSTDGTAFDTSIINAGASASATLSTAGSYPYYCLLHPWMQGTVTVQ